MLTEMAILDFLGSATTLNCQGIKEECAGQKLVKASHAKRRLYGIN
jgi:hypothetical protein